jgi:acyl dehydratase
MKTLPKNEMMNAVGMKLEPSDWIEISQQRINEFADCTEDHQFIHVESMSMKLKPKRHPLVARLLMAFSHFRCSRV